MENTAALQNVTEKLADPIIITQPEPWQWEVLATAFLNDRFIKFIFGGKPTETRLQQYFEAVIHDTLNSGGGVFSSPDRQVVLVWTWLGSSHEGTDKWKQRWHEVLGPESEKRYNLLYEVGEMTFDPTRLENTMFPDLIGVLPGSQRRGYGSHILKWTLDYYDKLGYETPFLFASSKRSAKLYGPLMGFHSYKEILLGEGDDAAEGVFMKRNGPVL
jgi:GNAT superfamily N-acetyltransferase